MKVFSDPNDLRMVFGQKFQGCDKGLLQGVVGSFRTAHFFLHKGKVVEDDGNIQMGNGMVDLVVTFQRLLEQVNHCLKVISTDQDPGQVVDTEEDQGIIQSTGAIGHGPGAVERGVCLFPLSLVDL